MEHPQILGKVKATQRKGQAQVPFEEPAVTALLQNTSAVTLHTIIQLSVFKCKLLTTE